MSVEDDFDLSAMNAIPDPVGDEVRASDRRPPLASSPTRREIERRRTLALTVGLVWLVGVVLGIGLRTDLAPSVELLLHVGVPALLGAAALAIALAPGRLGLGPSFRVGVALAVGAPLVFMICALVLPSAGAGGEFARGAFFCGDFGLLLGAVPLLALGWSQRRSFVSGAGLRSLLLGVAVGLIAAAALGMHCSNRDGLHVALGHGWPVIALGIVGAYLIAKRTHAGAR